MLNCTSDKFAFDASLWPFMHFTWALSGDADFLSFVSTTHPPQCKLKSLSVYFLRTSVNFIFRALLFLWDHHTVKLKQILTNNNKTTKVKEKLSTRPRYTSQTAVQLNTSRPWIYQVHMLQIVSVKETIHLFIKERSQSKKPSILNTLLKLWHWRLLP